MVSCSLSNDALAVDLFQPIFKKKNSIFLVPVYQHIYNFVYRRINTNVGYVYVFFIFRCPYSKTILVHTQNTAITQALAIQAREGNQQAVYKLYKMFVQPMYNISVRIVSNQLDAEDILKEAFITAFNSLNTLKEDLAFGRLTAANAKASIEFKSNNTNIVIE